MNFITKIVKISKSIMLNNMYGMITCKEFENFMQCYFDDDLDESKRTKFERHLLICRECRDYLAAYHRSVEMSKAVLNSNDDQVSTDVPEDLIKAILDANKN